MITFKLKNGITVTLNLYIVIGVILIAHYFHSWLLAIGAGCMVLAISK